MSDRRLTPMDAGGLITGLVFAVMGVAFAAEAAGAWSFRLSQLAVAGPALLIAAGLAVLLRATVAANGVRR